MGKFVRIVPDEGYVLHNTLTDTYHSDAIVPEKQVRLFEAVQIEAA